MFKLPDWKFQSVNGNVKSVDEAWKFEWQFEICYWNTWTFKESWKYVSGKLKYWQENLKYVFENVKENWKKWNLYMEIGNMTEHFEIC